METRRASLLITGKVQGVFFRESARSEALRLGVRGWVKNLPGGQVEALVEGPPQAVDEFIAWCHKGPPAARVDGVAVREAAASDGFTTFSVER